MSDKFRESLWTCPVNLEKVYGHVWSVEFRVNLILTYFLSTSQKGCKAKNQNNWENKTE
jgi:hypothetical protein